MNHASKKPQPILVAPVVHGRVPPNDLDTEAAVLSACLLDASALDEIADVARAEHCYSDANRLILAAILDQHRENKPVDLVTVADRLRAAGEIDRVGGVQYLAQIVDASPAIIHARQHAARVRELWRARQLIATCQVTSAEGYVAAHDTAEYLETSAQRLHECLESSEPVETCLPAKEWLRRLWERQQAVASGELKSIPTGLVDLDRHTPCERGDLVVVAGRPGMGKSALVQGWAVTCGIGRRGALLMSLEMPGEQVMARMQAQVAGVDLNRMLNAQLSPVEWQQITTAATQLAELPIMIDDRASASVVGIRSAVRRVKREMARLGVELELVAVDYAQLMRGEGQNREQEIASITRGLKVAARELDVLVVALAQLNRDLEKRQNRRPMLSDLRESGALEQDADKVIFVYRDDYYDENSQDRGVVELNVAKHRNGRTGVTRARWFGHCARFDNLAPAEQEGR